MPSWLKTILKIVAGLVIVIILLLVGLTLYVSSNKAKVLALINTKLNQNLDGGSLSIGDMNTSFFKGFPGVSLSLKNVTIRDKRFPQHHHTLLDAKDFDVSVNTAALLRGTIAIKHIDISNAAIDLFTDSTGYSNTSVFKKSKDKPKDSSSDDDSSSPAELGNFNLRNVKFSIDNQQHQKLFKFDVNELKGKMNFPDSGWRANVHLDVVAKSLAFNTARGSFIKDKHIQADIKGGFNEKSGKITAVSNNFNIGGDPFLLSALFAPGKDGMAFAFHLKADRILWKNAASLVAANISQTLYKFNLDKPIGIKANISGSFGGGDPLLFVTATVRNNMLTIPGAVINDCNFDGMFTNNFVNGKGLTDENSVIRLLKLSGSYNHLPFRVDTGSIINLAKPVATGNFVSNFPLNDLNYTFGKVAKFTNGTAAMRLRYKADVIDLRLNKPVVAGDIEMKNADVQFVTSNLKFKNTSIALHFIGDNLVLNNIRLQSGKSIVFMEGRVNNFLNLYYSAPEKIVLNWQITSPQLYLAEFIGFLNKKKSAAATKTPPRNSSNIIDQLSNVFNRSQAEMHMRVANVHYKNFLATDAKADLLVSEDGIEIKDIALKHAGGTLAIRGRLVQDDVSNRFNISSVVSNVNIRDFFYAFNNFGLTAPTYQNLKGFLSAKALVTGAVNSAGSVLPRSINGNVSINLRNGALVNFNPLKTVGKFAFPFRDLNNIVIPKLDASFDIKGEKITINPMQITSSVINADVAGVYSLGKGTNIAFDVPLRNPKGDSEITDKEELKKKRYRGIVLHLSAKDDENGKLKIGWNKDHK